MSPPESPENKDLIFIFEDTEAITFVSSIRAKTKGQILVVCSSDQLKVQLSNAGFHCKIISSYTVNADEEVRRARNWLIQWPDLKVLNGKSFKELLVYDRISIYWFLQTRLYLHRIRELIILLDRMKHVLGVEKPQTVWVRGNSDIVKIASKLANNQVKVIGVETGAMSTNGVNVKSYKGFPTLKILLLKLLRGTGARTGGDSFRQGRKVLVITETSSWRRVFNHTTKSFESRDIFFQDIIRGLAKASFNVKVIDFENRPKQVLKSHLIQREKQKTLGVPVAPWESYISLNVIRKSRLENKRLLRQWKELENSSAFAHSLEYDGLSLYDLLSPDIADLFSSLKAFAAVTFIEAAKRILERERPSIVIMHDEYGALQLAVIKAAKDLGIPTLSIQHGLISEEQIAYVHETHHIQNSNTDVLFPIPDKMCVWSEHFRDALIEIAKFPSNVIGVTGDPKLDYLPAAIKTFNHQEILARIGIPNNKKIVMFATENLPSANEKSIITNNVVDAIKQITECFLIIKLHPNESNINYYYELAEKAGLQRSQFTILKDVDLYEVMFVADLVIVSYSTVGLEAMRLQKPVISINILGLHDSVDFIKNNIAVVVRNPQELVASIRRCLDKESMTDIVTTGKAFAEKELGTIDSKASDTVLNIALQLMKGRQSETMPNVS